MQYQGNSRDDWRSREPESLDFNTGRDWACGKREKKPNRSPRTAAAIGPAVMCRNTQVFSGDNENPDYEVSFCEAQDPEGNLTWFVSNNEGSFDFLKGAGKFEGITGNLRGVGGIQRQDDVHVPKLELTWKVEN